MEEDVYMEAGGIIRNLVDSTQFCCEPKVKKKIYKKNKSPRSSLKKIKGALLLRL